MGALRRVLGDKRQTSKRKEPARAHPTTLLCSSTKARKKVLFYKPKTATKKLQIKGNCFNDYLGSSCSVCLFVDQKSQRFQVPISRRDVYSCFTILQITRETGLRRNCVCWHERQNTLFLTSLAAFTSAPLLINISATFSPSLIRAAMCNGVSSACN